MYCAKCGRQMENTAQYCPYCGAKVDPAAAKSGPLETGNRPDYVRPRGDAGQNSPEEADNAGNKIRCRIRTAAIAVSMILWFAAPYIAVDLFTFYQQPTAFQIITNRVPHWAPLLESMAFWASAACLLTYVFGLAGIAGRKHKAVHGFAVIAEILMGIALIQNVIWTMEGVAGSLGMGYWGQLVLFLIIIAA